MPRNEAEEIFKKIENIGMSVHNESFLNYIFLSMPALQIDPKLFIKIMGSFRRYHGLHAYSLVFFTHVNLLRGAETCGDIDILITRPVYDGKTHSGSFQSDFYRLYPMVFPSGVVRKIWRECHAKGIITEDLVMPDDFNHLELIYRGLCRKDETGKRRRIGMFFVLYYR